MRDRVHKSVCKTRSSSGLRVCFWGYMCSDRGVVSRQPSGCRHVSRGYNKWEKIAVVLRTDASGESFLLRTI